MIDKKYLNKVVKILREQYMFIQLQAMKMQINNIVIIGGINNKMLKFNKLMEKMK